jgi:hypothetical protein
MIDPQEGSMSGLRWTVCLALASAGAACTPARPAAVPVSAPGGSAALAGEWTGAYESRALGRSGSIVFRLAAGRDTAEGDVVMIPRGRLTPLQPAQPGDAGVLVRAALVPQVLTIRLVRLEGDRVSGALDPYLDPEDGHTVFTQFEGTLRGDRLEGTFSSGVTASGGTATGTWSMRRVP